MSVPMTPQAITARLRAVAEMTDLRAEARLDAKLEMTPGGIGRRLREVERLRRACLELGKLRRVDDT